jgi:hypothetical protein
VKVKTIGCCLREEDRKNVVRCGTAGFRVGWLRQLSRSFRCNRLIRINIALAPNFVIAGAGAFLGRQTMAVFTLAGVQ